MVKHRSNCQRKKIVPTDHGLQCITCLANDRVFGMELIKTFPVYKQILEDSFGGVMYNVANRSKYDAQEIITIWDSMSDIERTNAGGIMNGVFNYLKEV